jgi:2-Cys peroxiredoxin 5
MPESRLVGAKIPQVRIGEIVGGQLKTLRANDAFATGRAVIVGMPGAFTPICSEKHLPNLLSNADRLREAGFREIVCLVTSDPFAVDAWAAQLDPGRKIRFMSDGNLVFARALGLTTFEPRFFLGECSERYMLVLCDGVIESVRIESSILEFSCTNVDDLVLEIA